MFKWVGVSGGEAKSERPGSEVPAIERQQLQKINLLSVSVPFLLVSATAPCYVETQPNLAADSSPLDFCKMGAYPGPPLVPVGGAGDG